MQFFLQTKVLGVHNVTAVTIIVKISMSEVIFHLRKCVYSINWRIFLFIIPAILRDP